MSLRENVKAMVRSTGIRHAADRLSPNNGLLLRRYMRKEKVLRLHIGCGPSNLLPGWLNTDLFAGRNVMALDAMRPFPLPSRTFDYVYSEHMIEHVPFNGGANILREAFRVLKPGGRIRIVTPDFEFLMALRREPELELHRNYVQWAAKTFDLSPATPMVVINNFLRDWGHVFIYDMPKLQGAFDAAGFVDMHPCKIHMSDDANLAGLEFADRMPEGFLELESVVLEARRPV